MVSDLIQYLSIRLRPARYFSGIKNGEYGANTPHRRSGSGSIITIPNLTGNTSNSLASGLPGIHSTTCVKTKS